MLKYDTIPTLLRTSLHLGLRQCAQVAAYKLQLRLGTFNKIHYGNIATQGTFFNEIAPVDTPLSTIQRQLLLEQADEICAGNFRFFSKHLFTLGEKPNWFFNPFEDKEYPGEQKPWFLTDELKQSLGDIKCIWELSRFDWLPVLIRAYVTSNNSRYLDRANQLIDDWLLHSPPGLGPQWKCGQESSIRCINMILSSFLLRETAPSPKLLSFIESHARRIASTYNYAQAQDNNHIISEAAALFLCGALSNSSEGNEWSKTGRNLLEAASAKLILEDGSFSQHSVSYHRLMLDTLSWVEILRSHLQIEQFSEDFYKSCKAATGWLNSFVLESGDCPNLGCNDGAYPYKVHSADYRNFFPSLRLASNAFFNKDVNYDEASREVVSWIRKEPQVSEYYSPMKKDYIFSDGGYVVIRKQNYSLFFRGPKYSFRPGQADPMHIDLWVGDLNILQDGGSYSYNDNQGIGDALKSITAHNTIVFDNKEPMPRLGKFLYGDWIDGTLETTDGLISSSYRDTNRHTHSRVIECKQNTIHIKDTVDGNFTSAVAYFHLAPLDWQIEGSRLLSDTVQISFLDIRGENLELVSSPRSNYYQEVHKSPCLKVTLDGNILVSHISIL